MYSAPSVSYPVRRPSRARLLSTLFWAWGAAGIGVWCYQADSLGGRQLAALALLLLTAGLTWRAGQHAPNGELHWDGQYWSLAGNRPVSTAEATVHLDFQSLLLIRLKVDHVTRWLWLDQRASPERWRAVRRALFARAVRADPMDATS